MLTHRLQPEARELLASFPGGLLPLYSHTDGRHILVVKTTKELILASKLRRELKFYVVTFTSRGDQTAALATAIFDDEEEPLCIGTPLFDDWFSESLRKTLLQDEIDIYFFDEHGRELLGYRASISVPAATRDLLIAVRFFPPTQNLARAMMDGIPQFIGERTMEDDDAAGAIALVEPLIPEDIFFSKRAQAKTHSTEVRRCDTPVLSGRNLASFKSGTS